MTAPKDSETPDIGHTSAPGETPTPLTDKHVRWVKNYLPGTDVFDGSQSELMPAEECRRIEGLLNAARAELAAKEERIKVLEFQLCSRNGG